MQRSLIVNADEFGVTEGINEGIIEVHTRGIVTSTTMVANLWAFDDAARLANRYPSLAVGVHLNVTYGRPILPAERVHTLVDQDGVFYRRKPFLQRLLLGQISMIQVYEEFRAQIDKVIAAGINPSHIDSHESVYMYPDLFFKVVIPIARMYRVPLRLQQERMDREMFAGRRAVEQYTRSEAFWKNRVMYALARRYRVRLRKDRIPTTDHFLSTFNCLRRNPGDLYGGLIRDLCALESGTTELMVHPGFSDSRLATFLDGGEVAARWREEEVRVLTHQDLRDVVEQRSVERINYRVLSPVAAIA
ncbi:MAG: ChbG/HpnK family deacetylase [Chloroflexota bacterium]